MLKEVRTQLIEAARAVLEALIEGVTGVKALSLHHDISTATGEEIVLFTLADSPQVRETKRKSGWPFASATTHLQYWQRWI